MYRCIASYENVTVLLKNVNINVIIYDNKLSKNRNTYYKNEGDDVSFICFTFDNKNIVYKWYKDNKEIDFRYFIYFLIFSRNS